MGRDPTFLCVSRVFLLLNYDGGVCDNTGWYSRPLMEGEAGEDEEKSQRCKKHQCKVVSESGGRAVVSVPSALG